MVLWSLVLGLWPLLPGRPAATQGSVVLVVTNNLHGSLEPCGCAQGQRGGMLRLATAVRRLRERWPGLLLCDSGGLTGEATDPDKERALLSVAGMLRYNAFQFYEPENGDLPAFRSRAKAAGLPWVFPEGTGEPRVRLVQVTPAIRPPRTPPTLGGPGGAEPPGIPLTVAFVAAGGQPGNSHTPTSPHPHTSLRALCHSLRRQGTRVVLLSQRGKQGDRQLAAMGIADVIVGNSEWSGLARPLRIGRTWILPASPPNGERVGVAELSWRAPGGQPGTPKSEIRSSKPPEVSWSTVTLDAAVPDDYDALQVARDYYAAVSHRLLSRTARDAGYIRAEQCGVCHRAVFAAWQQTPHARAVQTLAAKGKSAVPECLGCHSEVFRRTGAAPADDTAGSGNGGSNAVAETGVACATCHGDGVGHAVRPSSGGVTARPGRTVCVGCHTAVASPRFAYAAAARKVHPWRRSSGTVTSAPAQSRGGVQGESR